MDIIEHYKQVRFRLWNAAQIAKKFDEKPVEESTLIQQKIEKGDLQPLPMPKRKITGLSTRRADPVFEILDKHNVTWDEVIGHPCASRSLYVFTQPRVE